MGGYVGGWMDMGLEGWICNRLMEKWVDIVDRWMVDGWMGRRVDRWVDG